MRQQGVQDAASLQRDIDDVVRRPIGELGAAFERLQTLRRSLREAGCGGEPAARGALTVEDVGDALYRVATAIIDHDGRDLLALMVKANVLVEFSEDADPILFAAARDIETIAQSMAALAQAGDGPAPSANVDAVPGRAAATE